MAASSSAGVGAFFDAGSDWGAGIGSGSAIEGAGAGGASFSGVSLGELEDDEEFDQKKPMVAVVLLSGVCRNLWRDQMPARIGKMFAYHVIFGGISTGTSSRVER